MDLLEQFFTLFLWYVVDLEPIVASPVEFFVDQDVELGMASHPLGFMIVIWDVLCDVLDNVLGQGGWALSTGSTI